MANLPTNAPDFLATIRGAMNVALTTSWCREPNTTGRPCKSCNCLYGTLNGEYWSGNQEHVRKFNKPPAPMLYWLPGEPVPEKKNGRIGFCLTLFGGAAHQIPVLVSALKVMASELIGAPGSFVVETVLELNEFQEPIWSWFEAGGTIASCPYDPIHLAPLLEEPYPNEQITLHFESLFILQQKGNLVGSPSVILLVQRLLARMCLLSTASCGATWEPTDHIAKQLAEEISIISANFSPGLWQKRDSQRNLRPEMSRKTRQYTGISGKITLAGKGLAFLLPYLRMGQYVHLGKLPVFGLGRYQLSI